MLTRHDLRRGLGLAAILVAAGAFVAGLGPARAEASPPAVTLEESPAEVRSYWTPERMRSARPARQLLDRLAEAPGGAPAPSRGAPSAVPPDLPGGRARLDAVDGVIGSEPERSTLATQVAQTRGYPERTHGRVFFRIPGRGSFYCSGTVVRSPGRSAVVTAGHCVYDDVARRFASHWMFTPGYENGDAPYGKWVARRLATTPRWRSKADLRYDVGVAIVRRNNNGRAIQNRVGARGIAFNQARNHFYRAYGYPAQSPYNGERLYRCDSPYRGDDREFSEPRPMRIDCDMTGGSSGGGWVVGDSYVASVISYGYEYPPLYCSLNPCPERDKLFGPYFGNAVRSLYRSNRGRVARCAGRAVTHLGTKRDDVLNGTGRGDVMHGAGGNDVLRGRGGSDVICGGAGNDVIVGGPGNNRIYAGPGNDRINARARGGNVIHATRGFNRIRCGPGYDRVVTNWASNVHASCNAVTRR